ncbi:response regulator transcription factor, partial [Mesorhizobium sp. M4A.F.Ca.ET.090.04.2.1]
MMFIPNLLSAESGSQSIVRARIVVVEDEPDLRDAVAEYLGASGY